MGKKILFFIFLISLFSFSGISSQKGQKKVELQSVEIARNLFGDTVQYYFSSCPVCLYQPSNNVRENEPLAQLVLFLPLAELRKSVVTKLKHLKEQSSLNYDIDIQLVTKPVHGLRMIITYDKQSLDISIKRPDDRVKNSFPLSVMVYDKKMLRHLADQLHDARLYA